jgi:putative salt-induced outer membrane protein YdiY
MSLTVAPALADEVTFVNGDKLTGMVVAMAGGKITFASKLAGNVTIAVGDVKGIVTDHPVKVQEVANGPTVELVMNAPDATKIQVGGRTVALAELKAINPPPPPSYPWRGNASLNLALLSNQVQSRNFSFAAGAGRTTPDTRIAVDSAYLFARQGQTTTEESAFLNGDYNFGLKNRLYGYGNARLRTDRIQRLEYRAIGGGGAGYTWVDGPKFMFATEGGLSLLNERFRGSGESSKVTGQLGYRLNALFLGTARFRHDLTYYPTLSDLSDSYLLSQFILEQPLAGSMYLDLRYIVDYTSHPGANAARSTSKLLFGLGKKF